MWTIIPEQNRFKSLAKSKGYVRPRPRDCRDGRWCSRVDCWFKHPDGRLIDRGAGPGDFRRSPSYAPIRRRRDERSETPRCQRQRSDSPIQRRQDRSETSQGRKTPRRQRHCSYTPIRRRRDERSETLRRQRQRSDSPIQRRQDRSETPQGREVPRRKRSYSDNSTQDSLARQKQKCAIPMNSKSSSRDSSPIEQDNEPAKTDTKELAISNPTPISLHEPVLPETKPDVTPDERIAWFEKKKIQQHLELLKQSSLLFDMYNPKALIQQHSTRMKMIDDVARQFVKNVQNNLYADLLLVATDTCSIFDNSTKCRLIGNQQAPHFGFDPDTSSLLLQNLPEIMSLSYFLQTLQADKGVSMISTIRLQDDRLSRQLCVHYASEETARIAEINFMIDKINAEHSLNCSALRPSPILEANVASPALSSVESIERDLKLSARLVRKLDMLCKIPEEVTEVLLNHVGSSAQKLDLQILYLRSVHYFCFYSCQWCSDAWELFSKCGPAFVRSNTVAEQACQEVVEVHVSRIESFIAEASLPEPMLPSLEDGPFRDMLEEHLAAQIQEISSAEFKCKVCHKAFRGKDFIYKHLQKKHPDLRNEVVDRACECIVETAYHADSMRPGWPLKRQRTSVGA